MADNTTLNTMSGGDVIATDDIAGVKYQRVKVGFGADGSFSGVESTSTNPLPVTTAAPATGAAELAKAADDASGGTDVGIANLVVRDDALTTLTPVDGDYVQQRCNSVGATWVVVDGTVTLAANSGVDIGDVDVTSISAGTNLIGDVGISGARTSGGTTPFYTNTATLQAVKASAGQMYWIHCMNLTNAKAYLQVFNLGTGSVTLGTTTPTMQFALPTQGDTNGAGFTFAIPNGIAMGTAISIAITSDSEGSTTLTSDQAITNIGYA